MARKQKRKAIKVISRRVKCRRHPNYLWDQVPPHPRELLALLWYYLLQRLLIHPIVYRICSMCERRQTEEIERKNFISI